MLADEVTGDPLTVMGVGWSYGSLIVLYVRDHDTTEPGATSKLHFGAREYVRRAVMTPAQPRAVTPRFGEDHHP